MKRLLEKIAIFLIAIQLLASCGDYNKVLKSTDTDLKYRKAMEYYEQKDYMRASTIIEELIPIFRGTERAEELSYIYAYCQYYQNDYEMAGFHFRNFSKTFPNSTRCLDADFRAAYCYYLDSPKPSLDQASTFSAITELQLFVEKYPESERAKDCNGLINTMREKLAEKSFIGAKLYYDLDEYKSAVISLKNSLKDYPDTKFREQIMYMIVKASFVYAEKSVQTKQKERFLSAQKEQTAYLNEFPQGKNLKEVNKMATSTQSFLDKLKTEKK